MSKQFNLGILINKHQKISSFQISFNYFTSFFEESDGKKKKKRIDRNGKVSHGRFGGWTNWNTWQGRQYPG